jgi:hypothetical protein
MRLPFASSRSVCVVPAALAILSCDPVHDDAVANLGPETLGIRKGLDHRAGQPCLLCHDGSIGNPPQFSVAGTVYEQDTSGALQAGTRGAKSVTLTFTDSAKHQATATTSPNGSGNFYLTPSDFVPTYPMEVYLEGPGTGVKATVMTSLINRNGSCAGCHVNPGSASSPGPIFVTSDGVVP